MRKLRPDFIALEEKRRELAKEHGATLTTDVPKENHDAFQKAYKDFSSTVVELDVQEITPSQLVDKENKSIDIEPWILTAIGDIYNPVPDINKAG